MSIETANSAARARLAAGPFAFPTAFGGEHEGMTLRDWFAGRAMQGLVGEMANAMAAGDAHFPVALAQTARLSYAIADAMLRERDRK